MEYFDGIEKQAGVQKKEIAREKFLFFVPEGEKFVFCSNDAQLQKWCEGVKTKKVKRDAIKFVIGAAKKVLSEQSVKKNVQQVSPHQTVQSSDKAVRVKKTDWSQENMILANFNQIFGTKKEDWVTQQAGYDDAGRAMSKATVKFNGKVYSEKAYSNKDAMREVAISILDEHYNTGIRARKNQEFEQQKQKMAEREKQRQRQNMEKAKYYKVLMERPDVEVFATSWKDVYQYRIATDYGVVETDRIVEAANGINVFSPFESEDISLEMIKKASPSKEERKDFNAAIDDIKQEYIDMCQENVAKRQKAEQEMLDSRRKAEYLRERIHKEKEETLLKQLENVNVIRKMTDKGRQYQMQTTDGTEYILDISLDVINQEKRKYRQDWDGEKQLIEAKNVDMKTLTVGYQKISDGQKEEFSVQASTPHLNTTNESLGRMLKSNMKMFSKNSENNEKKEQLFVLKMLLDVSKDPLVVPNKQNAQAISKSARENR